MTLTFNVGDMRVDRIIEQELPGFDPFEFFPNLTKEELEEHRAMLEPNALDPKTGLLVFTMQSYVVRAGGLNILIDSCIGNDKNRPTRPLWHMKTDTTYMDALKRAGLTVEDIDVVMCTHLHPDHVGWNTMLVDGKWVPTFPKARYLIGRREWDFWSTEDDEDNAPVLADSVQPIFDAGLADLVSDDHVVCDEVRLRPTPGHTPGHVSIVISSKGETAIITGDLMHHPCQMARTDWRSAFDTDGDMAEKTRHAFLAEMADENTLVIGTHFATPAAGRVKRDGAGYRLEV
jgi:glyoxylase-like metal-dependent hydrolase (beta-lactamase superfamily II)